MPWRGKEGPLDQASFHYLREAEVLIYNPADRAQERRVAELSAERQAALAISILRLGKRSMSR